MKLLFDMASSNVRVEKILRAQLPIFLKKLNARF